MKKLLLSAFFCASTIAGFSTTWTITSPGFMFSPDTVNINVGDSVLFTLTSFHSGLEVDQTTWNANGNTPLAGGFATPLGGGLVLPAQLTIGTHWYVCSVHYLSGMKGVIIVNDPLGTKSVSLVKLDLTIFPNPSEGKFQLAVNDKGFTKGEMGIYNVMGEKVFESMIYNETSTIDLSNQPKGIYFVRLISDKGTVVRKINIQ